MVLRADRLRDPDRRADRLDRRALLSWRCSSWRSATAQLVGLQRRWRHADRGYRAGAGAARRFITLTATVLLFAHRPALGDPARAGRVLHGAAGRTSPSRPSSAWRRLADAFSGTFILALQISSPFIVYALIINLMVGIANKLMPQIPVYFISMPFVLAGGLLLLYFTVGEALRLFIAGFIAWLRDGLSAHAEQARAKSSAASWPRSSSCIASSNGRWRIWSAACRARSDAGGADRRAQRRRMPCMACSSTPRLAGSARWRKRRSGWRVRRQAQALMLMEHAGAREDVASA